MEDWSVCLKNCCRKRRGGKNERLRSRGGKRRRRNEIEWSGRR